MRKFSATIFFFLLFGVLIFPLSGPAFSAVAPPAPGAMEGDDDLGLGDMLPEEEEKGEKWTIVKPEDIPPIKMVFVQGGCFQMGDWEGEGDDDERPVHEVCLSDYYIAETEVTQEVFQTVMGYLPAWRYNKNMPLDPKAPVTYVSWHIANQFVERLNLITGGYYRLPTEAEWEYAARSRGMMDKWPGLNNEAEIGDYAVFEDNSDFKLSDVKQKKPNSLGIYDMAGNAWEWTEDYFDFDYYQVSEKQDPYGPDYSFYRTLRGGSYMDPSYKLRTTYRYAIEGTRRAIFVGIRLAE